MERFCVLIPEKRTSLSGPLSCAISACTGSGSMSLDTVLYVETSSFSVDHAAFHGFCTMRHDESGPAPVSAAKPQFFHEDPNIWEPRA